MPQTRSRKLFFPRSFDSLQNGWRPRSNEKDWIIPSTASPLLRDGAIPTDYPSNLSRAYLARMAAHVATAAVIYRHLAKNAVTDSSADA